MENNFKHRTFIIAEAGVNHNGNLKIAKRMIDAAVKAGADAVKFQAFKAEELAASHAPKASYQMKGIHGKESHLAMLKKLELDRKALEKLMDYCARKGIIFVASPFDLKSIELLDELGVKIFKIPSGEITNLPYLRKIGTLKKKIILSTGMSNLREIGKALSVLINAGTRKKNIVVLQCNSQYPTPPEDANLNAMMTIKKIYGVNIGYSDHTIGIELPIAAAAMGTSVIEKHFTLDKDMTGPDHKASLEPDELKEMVRAIRKTEKMLGDGLKKISPSEIKNIKVARKSIIAVRPIKKGEVFTNENLSVKRPGTGLNPMKWDMVIGSIAKKDFIVDELIVL